MLVFFQNCSRKPILCATNMKHWLVESFGTIGSQTFFLHFLQQIGTNFILLARFSTSVLVFCTDIIIIFNMVFRM